MGAIRILPPRLDRLGNEGVEAVDLTPIHHAVEDDGVVMRADEAEVPVGAVGPVPVGLLPRRQTGHGERLGEELVF